MQTLKEKKGRIDEQRSVILKAANRVLYPLLTRKDAGGIVYELDKAGFEIVRKHEQ
ncbi:hypothetical protein AB1P65_09600 [Roseibium alexandrii]